MIKQTVTVVNKLGLHARAATKFVSRSSQFRSEIEVSYRNHTINGKSIMGVMMLGAARGAELEIKIHGEDEQAAAQALLTLINNKFDEDE